MLTVHIICVGKLKEAYLRAACAEYEKRLSAYCRLTVTEVAEARMPENPSPAQIEAGLREEGERILAKISNGSEVAALCIEGGQMPSEAFSGRLETLAVKGVSRMAFLIGGSWGLSSEVKRRAAWQLSFSKMTFPHQLARVMLLEQLYRAFQISHSGKYHK